ncbi:hypothetical protein ABZ545_21190 [Streptomyces abikoensis]|uniref:hypothetical protein n=1 Tax=Streptomyces abikoensis TaxID=97398 RepID=UPI0033C3ADB5
MPLKACRATHPPVTPNGRQHTMTSGHKTLTAFLTVIGALLIVIIGLCVEWPLWAWPASAAVLVAIAVVAVKAADRRRSPFPQELMLEPDLPIPPLERREQRITDVALPSDTDDYDFIFSATVRWCPIDDAPADAPVVNAGSLAIDAVLNRAREITARKSPGRSTLAQYQLNGELGTMLADPTGRVYAMAENVLLTLSDQDQERLAKLSAVRKDEAVWEHERKYEQSRRAYLGGDVLKNTGSAVVWWLAKNDDKVDKAVADLGLLAQLSSAANNQDVPERFRHLVPQPVPEWGEPVAERSEEEYEAVEEDPSAADRFDEMLNAMGFDEDDPRRSLFAERVARAAAAADQHGTAEEIRQRFDAPKTPDDGAGPPFGPPDEAPTP